MARKRIKGNPECTECSLYRTCQITNIMGSGPEKAEIMVVLDSPGYVEDQSGRPIDGKMRNFLYGLLEEAGINPKKVFFTNAVKCAPPRGHKIKVKEINACKQYLEKEIKVIKPRYILAMGATALKAIIGKGKVTEEHGTLHELYNATVMPVYSPGIAFRDPKQLVPLKQDLKKFARVIAGKRPPKPKINFRVVESFNDFNEMIEDLKRSAVTSWDIETTSLNRFEGVITMMGFGLKGKQWILPMEFPYSAFQGKPEIQQEMFDIITEIVNRRATVNKKRRVNVTHNGKFDNLWARHHLGKRFRYTFDTMIAHYCLDENDRHGLKYLARILLDAQDWDVDLGLKQGDVMTRKQAYKLYEYLAHDVYYTRKLYFHLNKELKKDKPTYNLFRWLMMPIFEVYEDVQEEGVYIRQHKFEEVDKLLNERISEVDKKLEEIKKEEGLEINNWGSTQQVADVLFKQLELPILEKTATGNPSTGESVLMRLRDEHPVVELLLERRGLKQTISFFINGWKKRMHNGKIYPNFNIHVTVTGRTSSNEPNLQQVPRDKQIRSLIGAPPGWTFMEVDYSQIELRIVAMLSGDATMNRVFAMGEDIHSTTASSLNGKPPSEQSKEDRKSAKAVNFGFVYGMGWRKFKDYARDNYGVKLTEKEAELYRKRFFETYNELPDWHEKQRRIARMFKQVRNPIGRLRRLPEVDSPDKGKVAEAERQSINSPVQSFGSDLMLMSLIELNKKFDPEEAKIVGSVHDAGLFIVRDDKLNKYAPMIKETMESPELLEKFQVKTTIPIEVDVEIGDWGVGKEWQPGQTIIPNGDGTVEIV